MEEIVAAKAEQAPKLREQFDDSSGSALFAHSTIDTYWGTGLNSKATVNTDHAKWPR